MTRLWRAYRFFCVAAVSVVLAVGAVLGGVGVVHALAVSPISTIASPDGAFRVAVFSAGQGLASRPYRRDRPFGVG